MRIEFTLWETNCPLLNLEEAVIFDPEVTAETTILLDVSCFLALTSPLTPRMPFFLFDFEFLTSGIFYFFGIFFVTTGLYSEMQNKTAKVT